MGLEGGQRDFSTSPLISQGDTQPARHPGPFCPGPRFGVCSQSRRARGAGSGWDGTCPSFDSDPHALACPRTGSAPWKPASRRVNTAYGSLPNEEVLVHVGATDLTATPLSAHPRLGSLLPALGS